MRAGWRSVLALSSVLACAHRVPITANEAWANTAPTRVERVIERGEQQLLSVSQGSLVTWVLVPAARARVGDFILLTQGTPRYDVLIPELGQRAAVVVDIARAQIVDSETATRVLAAAAPADAVPIVQVYAELTARAGSTVVVSGTVVKATRAVGAYWVHLQDGTGEAASGTHDLTVRTQERVVVGQRVAFVGTLRQDVELGFGYHYAALVENGSLLD